MTTIEIEVDVDESGLNEAGVAVLVGSPLGAAKIDPKSAARTFDPTKAPFIAEYQLVARFASSEQSGVFLTQKKTPDGGMQRFVMKLAPRSSHDYALARTRLFDELQAMLPLQHPNIVSLVEANEANEGFFIIIEYVEGIDAATMLDRLAEMKVRLPISLVAYITREILEGLSHAHEAKDGNKPLQLIHRDANPSNMLLASDGRVKLADFGISRIRSRLQSSTLPGVMKGKMSYFAPEYLTGKSIDHRIDVYSVGVTLFELLTGTKAFPTKAVAQTVAAIVHTGLKTEPLLALGLPSGIAGQLEAIVRKATARDPSDRYASAREMAQDIENLGALDTQESLARFLAGHRLVTPIV